MLGAAVVAGERVERLGEPPQPLLERAALVAGEPPVAPGQLAVEQQRHVGPATPFVARHVPQGGPKRGVRAGVVPGDVLREARQRLAPPRRGAARLGGGERVGAAAALEQVAHPLARDPVVTWDRSRRRVEPRD